MLSQYGAITLAMSFIGIEWKYKPLRRFYKALDLIEENNKMHSELRVQMESMKKKFDEEFTYNGGKSSKDILRLLLAQNYFMFDKHQYGIFMCDKEGDNFYVNRTYADELHCQIEDLKHRGWENFVMNSEEYKEIWAEKLSRNNSFTVDIDLRRTNGELITATIDCSPLNTVDGFMGYVKFKPNN